MKRIACLFVSAFFLAGGIAYAQGEMNAYTMSQTDLNGTARYLGMSGAFGALVVIYRLCLLIRQG